MLSTIRMSHVLQATAICAGLVFTPTPGALLAQENGSAEPDATNDHAHDLRAKQQAILDNYNETEQLLLQMAEYLGAEDPHRAALLRKAFQQSSENSTRQRLEELVTLLDKDGRASTLRTVAKSQQQVLTDFEALLKLLMSENRAKRNQDEQRRIRKYLERVNKAIRKQRAITDQTQRGDEPKKQASKQGDLADETSKLGGELAEDPATTKPIDSDSHRDSPATPAKPPQDGKPNPDKPIDGKPQDGKPNDGKPQDAPMGDGTDNPMPGVQGKSSDASAPPQQSPAAERLRAAEKKMREAQQDLEQAKREGAIQKQQEALRKLEQAKAELERILRQLRLEEDEQQLELLEARFKAILKLQRKVHESTQRLDGVPADDRDADDEIEASRLARSQNEIISDVDKALLLLHEEGSAVAMTEVVTQMRDDMRQIAQRLSKQQTGELTQAIQQDVLAALEEILAALDKAIKDSEERKQSGQTQPGMPQDPPLVDTIAELKMLKSMQFRVRRRTAQYNKMLAEKSEQATEPELLKSLEKLAERQNRIFGAARDIATGKNR